MSDFKNFLAFDVVGSAYAPPVPDLPAPSYPNIFDVLNGVDERNPAKPTGQEDPQLGTSSFNANDVMNGAPEIPFEEDTTGGFEILNPLDTLDGNLADPPTQELETIPYPGGSGSSSGGGTPAWNGSEIKQPSNPSGTAKPPDASGSAKPPTTDGSYKYPGT